MRSEEENLNQSWGQRGSPKVRVFNPRPDSCRQDQPCGYVSGPALGMYALGRGIEIFFAPLNLCFVSRVPWDRGPGSLETRPPQTLEICCLLTLN